MTAPPENHEEMLLLMQSPEPWRRRCAAMALAHSDEMSDSTCEQLRQLAALIAQAEDVKDSAAAFSRQILDLRDKKAG